MLSATVTDTAHRLEALQAALEDVKATVRINDLITTKGSASAVPVGDAVRCGLCVLAGVCVQESWDVCSTHLGRLLRILASATR